MSDSLARVEREEDIRFDFDNHIPDQYLLSSCRLLRLPCPPRHRQDFVEAFYRYSPINTNVEIWYLDFYNQSIQDHPLPQTRWNNRILFCVGFYQESRQNRIWPENIVVTTPRTRVPVNQFQLHTVETRAVFPIDRIVRGGTLPADFVRGNFCVNPQDQRYFYQAPTYEEWLAKQDQVPLYYIVRYRRQDENHIRNTRCATWRDRVTPSWVCTVSTFERSSTGTLLEQSTSTIRSHKLNIIHDEKVRREEEKNTGTWAIESAFNKILNPYVTHIIYITLLSTWVDNK
jgi:hypothetical protein